MNRTPVPIVWPEWWTHRTWYTKALVGMPFVGPHVRMLRMVEHELRSRDPSCLQSWGNDSSTRDIVRSISAVIKDRMGWPSALFVPADTLDLLLGNMPGLQLDDEVTTLREICYIAGVNLEDLPSDILTNERATLGAFVAAAERGHRGHSSKARSQQT